jgi:hypothetical protein
VAPTSGLTPAPATTPYAHLHGVSCASTTSCLAVGEYQDTSVGYDPLIETGTLSGGSWTWRAATALTSGLTPTPATKPKVFLEAASCPSTTSCLAVGKYQDTSLGDDDPLIETGTLSGGRWSWSAAVAPTKGLTPAPYAPPYTVLSGISCASATSCAAGGQYTGASNANSSYGLLETEHTPAPVSPPTTTSSGSPSTATTPTSPPTTSPPTTTVPPTLPAPSLPRGVTASSYGPATQATVGSGATTLQLTSAGATATVDVPAGALPPGTTVGLRGVADPAALEKDVPAGRSYITSFALTWVTGTGSSPAATSSLTMTIKDPSIVAGDVIYEYTTAGLIPVGKATANGSMTITFRTDPAFVVAALPHASAATTYVANAHLVALRVSCSQASTCVGLARLNVARARGEIEVAAKHFSLKPGHSAPLGLALTARGKHVLARSRHHRGFRLGLVITLTGGGRTVQVVRRR